MKVITLDLRVFDANKEGIHRITTDFEVPKDNYRKNVELFSRPQLLKQVRNLCGWFNPASCVLRYVDEDGDEIVLDDLDSYVEVVKLAERTGILTMVIGKRDNLSAADHVENEQEVPLWLAPLIEKMKAEVKEEILESLNKYPSPPVAATDCKPKSEKVKKHGRTKPGESKDDALFCKNCQEQMKEPLFFCLEKKCTAIICGVCVGSHPVEHVMLRLPQKLHTGRRKLVEMASLVLFSRERERKRQETDKDKEKRNEKQKKSSAPLSLLAETQSGFLCDVLSTEVSFVSDSQVVVCWNVKNPGNDWMPGVKLECLTISHPDLSLPLTESSKIIDPLKSDETGSLIVKFNLCKSLEPGNYFTHWILTYHGFRFATLSAVICAKKSMNVTPSCGDTQTIIDMKNKQDSLQSETAVGDVACGSEPIVNPLDLFLRSEELKQKSESLITTEDDLLSQYSCVSSDSSAHDFEVVLKNPFLVDLENPFKDDADSYVLATPLNTTDEVDDFDTEIINRSKNGTDFLTLLTNSLSTLASEANNGRPPVVDDETAPLLVDFETKEETSSEAIREKKESTVAPLVDANSVSVFEDAVAEPLSVVQVINSSETETFFLANEPFAAIVETIVPEQQQRSVADIDEEERRELDELARSVQNYQIQPPSSQMAEELTASQETLIKTVVESSTLVDDNTSPTGQQQSSTVTNGSRSDTVATVLNTALRVSSQALSTVSNVLQAVSSSAAGSAHRYTATSSINGSIPKAWQPPHSTWQPTSPIDVGTASTNANWQPPKAWVPKSTQTQNTWLPPPGWTPPNTSWEKWSTTFDAKMRILKDMGFQDEFKNYTLLVEHGGQMERVVAALLSEISLE